jgi:hypothetical protein
MEILSMKPTKLIHSVTTIGFGAALALASGPASAVISLFSPVTAFQDDNLDYVVDNNSNGIIDVGDRIISVLEIQNTQGILSGQGPNAIGPEELTGVADITVAAVLPDGRLVFAPSGAAGVLSGFAAGTMFALWTDATPDLNVINAACGTRAACLLAAGLGAGDPLYLTGGFFGDPDNFWVSTPAAGGTSIATVQAGSSSATFGAFTFAVDAGINNTGVALGLQPCAPFCNPVLIAGQDGMVDITGSGNILGGQGLVPAEWTARSDTDSQIVPIPEPGSLALLGAALMGAGWMRRKLKQ